MEVHTFRASSLQDALQQVRQTLGPDAAVLHTRELKQRRFGFFAKPVIEVEASVDVPVASRFPELPRTAPRVSEAEASRSRLPAPGVQEKLVHRKSTPQPLTDRHAAPAIPVHSPNASSDPAPRRRPQRPTHVGGQADTFPQGQPSKERSDDAAMTPAVFEILSELVEHGVAPQLAKQLLIEASERCGSEQRHDPWLVRASVHRSVANRLNVNGSVELSPRKQKVVALVGPTGVGKTTSLAKIAAGFRFDLGCQVGLITLDTFRLGAVDQLLQYAELITAPLEVVSSPDQVSAAIQRLRECDLILLDTAGRAPRDTQQLLVLNEFLRAAQPDSTHLVVSASSSVDHVQDTINQFSRLEPSHLLVTKLDEAVRFGSWMPLLFETTLPVSYLTTGQHVPQDIVVASPRRLATELLACDQRMEQSV